MDLISKNLNNNKKGNFTLIELLIAISLFATIVVALYSALSVGVYSWKRGDQATTLYQKSRVIFEKITYDIRNCVYFSYIQFVGKANEIYFAMSLPINETDKKAKGVFDTNIFKVTYLMDRGSYRDKNKTLFRKQETFLESISDSSGKPKEAASGIVELSFQYPYKVVSDTENPEDSDYTIEWKDEWKMKNKIPMGVKIKMVLSDDSKDDDKNSNPEDNYMTCERTVLIPQGTLEEEEKEDEGFDIE